MFSVPSHCVPHTALSCRANSLSAATAMQWDTPTPKAKTTVTGALALPWQPLCNPALPFLSLCFIPETRAAK